MCRSRFRPGPPPEALRLRVLRLTRGVGRAVAVVLSVAALLVAALLMRLGAAESALSQAKMVDSFEHPHSGLHTDLSSQPDRARPRCKLSRGGQAGKPKGTSSSGTHEMKHSSCAYGTGGSQTGQFCDQKL